MKEKHKNVKNRNIEPPKSLFFLLLVSYLATFLYVTMASRSQSILSIWGNEIPLTAFTGVLSSFANLCIIFLVVFFKKTGFITSLVLMLFQFPFLFISLFIHHSISSLPGFFTNCFTIFAIILIYQGNKRIEKYREAEVENLKNQQKISQDLFEQTATALVNAIDAKDTYSHGHSLRVAEYSEKIARLMGKDEKQCRQIYYAGLLHDVGKIGIPIKIINKKGKLTPQEYDTIKEHPVKGDQILSGITKYPYLAIGAHYHHERYDGQGYPLRLKGEDIPEIARIISVADAYDAMSSNRSYRQAIPQQLVREEIVKGSGSQFDPGIAKIMQHLIDMDTEYKMKEMTAVAELSGKSELSCTEYRREFSDGILINPFNTRIHIKVSYDGKTKTPGRKAEMIIFDSLDGRIHLEEKTTADMNYYEYCEVFMDGSYESKGVRRIKTDISENTDDLTDIGYSAENEKRPGKRNSKVCDVYDIDAVRLKDHMLLRIAGSKKVITMTIALPDNTRYTYISLTGENCEISDVTVNKSAAPIGKDYIPRIAEEVSFIKENEGDIPNVQMDDYRTDASEGISVKDHLELSFHSMSLPTARLIWHCAYLILFSSDDGTVDGENYREYALVRLDGENWDTEDIARNDLIIDKRAGFAGWDNWKARNKEGIDVKADIVKKGNVVTITTENLNIYLKNTTTILDGTQKLYVSITGDQCAITNIRIKGSS